MIENIIERAIIFAADAHRGQLRKGTALPYIAHPAETLAIVAGMTDDPEILAAAVLHDTIEDTATTKEQLQAAFGDRVTALVCADTEDKQKDKPAADTWKQRKQETLDFLTSEADIAVKMIALGDKLSNLRCMYVDYMRIGDKLWKRFNQTDPTMQAWYYACITEAVREFAGFPAWQEYVSLLKKVFKFNI